MEQRRFYDKMLAKEKKKKERIKKMQAEKKEKEAKEIKNPRLVSKCKCM